MTRWVRGQLLVALALAFGLAACDLQDAEDEAASESSVEDVAPEAAPEIETAAREPVTFVATDFAYEGPDRISAGLTELVLNNEGDYSHSLIVVGLGEDKELGDLLDILDDEGPIPDWVGFSGGIGGIQPGQSASAVVDLEPGRYAVFSFESADGEEETDAAKGMIKALDVEEADGASAEIPEAAVTVDMLDFGYEVDGSLGPGRHTLAVHNAGEQPHEALIMKLSEGVTAGEVVAMINEFTAGGGPPEGEGAEAAAGDAAGDESADEAGDEAGNADEGETESDDATVAEEGAPEDGAPMGPPFDSAGGLGPIGPGETGYYTGDFEPGEYMLICFIPDPADGAMHLSKGMFQPFRVR